MHKLTSSWIISYVRRNVLTKVKIIYIKYRNFSPKKKNFNFPKEGEQQQQQQQQKNRFLKKKTKPLGLNHG